ncbi:hypothetical protein F5144DRAFT_617386 [Chaetomium tenue]|uniref:Uncharacterized protein n=1 Tax=Chaetomium tenue TaxID=1854479 RepID=A0ACB7PQC4_9PEZI|nr:hypothetical protein F5144DRAFT_617386 [Chaetomium globosum]
MSFEDDRKSILVVASTAALCVLAGTIATWLWFSHVPALPKSAPPPPAESASKHEYGQTGGVRLDIDIIAIHGLDTRSPDTWTWRGKSPSDNVNWLAHPEMLPSKVGAARIFTCDWPADLLQPSNLAQKRIEEYALLLLEAIYRELCITDTATPRPVFFIASCLGGIVLAKALVDAGEKYLALRRATCGIVFLATPFRGTSFRDVAALAEPGLKVWASLRGRQASELLDELKGSTFDLETLVREFTQLCQDKNHPCLVFTFYEKGKTSLPLKVLPWVPGFFRQEKQLVDETSATLDIVLKPLSLDRPHVLTNKFGGPECSDYKKVAGKIQQFLGEIRKGTPLMQADAWIRDKHYTAARLEIETLSGDVLPMDRCYINLAIIEQPRSKGDSKTESSPFSLSARLNVEEPDKDIQVELATLFGPRKRDGRAGVGKTTSCKKIVHEFTHGTWSQWNELFDRILWVPLRNLKLEERRQAGYNFVDLFSHEYFSSSPRRDLASTLADTLEGPKNKRNLFLLDGLDEVSQDLGNESSMFRLLKDLLNQPNVIITSRPSGKLPLGLDAIDVELETIGFYPDQVDKYLERVLPNQVTEIQSFLRDRPLLQDLVRIPIQLDAFGFTWNETFSTPTELSTMTAVYQAIEDGLWKKDVLRLEKRHQGEPLTGGMIQDSDAPEIKGFVKDEICFLEGFAFTGLHNDIIDLESKHQRAISARFSPVIALPAKTLPRLSFLRTSDTSPTKGKPSYHFLHLTYQEYFAARYFVRQWRAGESLKCLALSNEKLEEMGTSNFLRKHKYTARYGIFWRFVAGLLDAEGKGEEFFKAIEEQPRDLLGPVHQRLVMHCLSETSPGMPLRSRLEEGLKVWLLFECKNSINEAQLARQVEFPGRVLSEVLQEESDSELEIRTKIKILMSVARRPTLPSSIVDMIIHWLKNGESKVPRTEILDVLSNYKRELPAHLLNAVVELILYKKNNMEVRRCALGVLEAQPSISDEHFRVILELAFCKDGDQDIRNDALGVLQVQPYIADKHLPAVLELALCKDEDQGVRNNALWVLQVQPSISDEHLTAVLELGLCRNEYRDVRKRALRVLPAQPNISDEHLTAVLKLALCKEEDQGVRNDALWVLQVQPSISDEHLTALLELVLCKDEDQVVRNDALWVLQVQPSLSDEHLTVVLELVLCEDEGVEIRDAALKLLKTQPSISDKHLRVVLKLVLCGRGDWNIRDTALEVLKSQPNILGKYLKVDVVTLLEDEDGSVGNTFRLALKRQSIFDEPLLAVTPPRFWNGEDRFVSIIALEILRA